MSHNIYLCEKCGHAYDSSLGDPQQCIPPDHEISEVLQVWRCPDCRADGTHLAEFMVNDGAADVDTAKSGTDSPLRRLLKIAQENEWCTKFYCTTCGARRFRNALGMLPRDRVIRYLRELPEELCWSDAFKIIATDIGVLPWGGDLLDELDGTPAALKIRGYIQKANERYERHQAYMATQTPEAIAQRRTERVKARAEKTQPHRNRSDTRNASMRPAREYLDSVPTKDLLEKVMNGGLDVPIRALGGYLFKRLLVHYRSNSPNEADVALMILLASSHAGHWAKLIDKLRLDR